VSPARRRRAVEHLQQVLDVSQRWACQLVGQHRSTQRHQPTEPDRDRALREQLRTFSRAHPRWGYRRAHAQLRGQGWRVNRKAVQRRWREEGLRVPTKRRKRQRLGTSTCPADRLAAEHRTMCGRWTTSSTRPPTQGPSSCSTSWTNTPARP
jgi:transposase InsO family protein